MYQNSKIEVRLEAIKQAVALKDVTSRNIIQVSKTIEKYIIGEAELPEMYDTNGYLKELMNKLCKINEETSGKNNEIIKHALQNEKEKAN